MMNDSLLTVEQASANSLVPNSLILQLKAENIGYAEVAAQAKGRIMRCGDLLRQARAAVPADQWEKWLADNFEGSAGLARYYMEYGTKLETSPVDSDDSAQVIPPPGKSLRFSDNDRDGGSALCIEPAYREGYYFVTLVTWDRDHDFCSSHAEGPSGPILRDEVWETCQRFQYIDLIESGERTELTSTPLAFNRWLYEGHEQQHIDRQRCQGIGEVKECGESAEMRTP